MFVTRLGLHNYRNLERQQLFLSDGMNIFAGRNAQGKTNLLESIYLCASGRAKRARHDRELVRFGEREAYVQLHVSPAGGRYPTQIDIHLRDDRPKGIAINGLAIHKLAELFGKLLCVIFTPEDLLLIKEGPAERRRFIDMEMCQVSRVYVYHLQTFHHVLKQRNSLLKSLKGDRSAARSLRDTMSVWDNQLAEHGAKIYRERVNFVEGLHNAASGIHSDLTGGRETLSITYKPNILPEDFPRKLEQSLERDIALGSTSVGIHKDDLYFAVNGVDARVYGSQGQQRTASLAAKLAQIEMVTKLAGQRPVLLLDDVLSELDEHRQTCLMRSISGIQTVITCTGVEDVVRKISGATNYNIYNIEHGAVTQ
ncbi:MAG: DNA replication/repair protein RecF [Defluviitaleaceae bacterium]|nr:DNA replication/repair protein RecF [Defluviitaleaceae bacterium]